MGYKRQDVEATKQFAKKFVRYKEGAEKYSLGMTKFQALAKEAKAVYKIDGVALVNCELLNDTWRPSENINLKKGFTANKFDFLSYDK